MPKSEMDEITEKTVARGGILAKMYFDMQSEQPGDLQPLMAELINNRLMKSQGVVYCYGSIDEPIKLDNIYSTNAIVTILLKDLGALINAAFNFTPAGVEILRPEKEYVEKISDLQSLMLDIAQISVSYSKYILEKALSKEDYEKVMRDIKSRELLGRRLLEKKEGQNDEKPRQ